MIKAEVITHEGNPGPNWLDHCKALATPWTVTALIVVAAIIFTVGSTRSRDAGQADQLPTTAHSQQAAGLNPLQVESDIASDNVQPSATGSVQATPGASTSATPGAGTATVLGAKATPSLNTAKTAGASTAPSSNNTADPTQVNGNNLTQTVQTTTGAVKQVTDSLTNKLFSN